MAVNLLPSEGSELQNLYEAIFSKCHQQATGTFFLASDSNRSGQVVLHQGTLLGISYGGDYNRKAVESLLQQSSLRHSFTAELVYPVAETLLPDSAEELLLEMGMAAMPAANDEPVIEPEPAPEPEPESAPQSKRSVRIYRGQIVNS